mgnify:FL=1
MGGELLGRLSFPDASLAMEKFAGKAVALRQPWHPEDKVIFGMIVPVDHIVRQSASVQMALPRGGCLW